jgi:hypothetical protein
VLNPCNGEIVEVTGEFTGFSQVVQTPTGQTVTRFHLVSNGTGVGSEGNQYVFHQTFNGQVNGRPPFTDNVSELLISQGSADNFVVNLVLHVNEAGEIEFIKVVDSQCRG